MYCMGQRASGAALIRSPAATARSCPSQSASVLAIDVGQALLKLTRRVRVIEQIVQSRDELDRIAVIQPPSCAWTWPRSTLQRAFTSAGRPWFQASSSTMLRLSNGDGIINARARVSSASRSSSLTKPSARICGCSGIGIDAGPAITSCTRQPPSM
jgi:hypothetical protein